jgi:hypothetical protein
MNKYCALVGVIKELFDNWKMNGMEYFKISKKKYK